MMDAAFEAAGAESDPLGSSPTQLAFAAFAAERAALGVSEERWEEAQTLLRLTSEAAAAGKVTAAEQEACVEGVLSRLFLTSGARVSIAGLSAKPELNGRVGTVVGALKDGRVPVEIPDGPHVKLRVANTRPAAAPPAGEAAREPGSLVEVVGLASASAAAFNGCLGEVLPRPDGEAAAERVPVRVHVAGENKFLQVKPANLVDASGEKCVADGEALLGTNRAGHARDALARADCALAMHPRWASANLLHVRAVHAAGRGGAPSVAQAEELASAVLGMAERCGLAAVPADVCVSTAVRGWPRERAITYTVALAALSLKDRVRSAHGGTGALRVALLGCRAHVEGGIDWRLLAKLLCRVLELGECKVTVSLVGPEMHAETDDDKSELAKAVAEMCRAEKASAGAVEVVVRASEYHHLLQQADAATSNGYVSPRAAPAGGRPHLAVVLNGGVDSAFGSWGPTLASLLRDRVPSAFTGYGGQDGAPTYDGGLAPLLTELMGAELACAPHPNPFRFVMMGRASDAFLLGVCGVHAPREPPTDAQLPEIHALERAARLEVLADLNVRDGQLSTAAKLREARAQLQAGEIEIPPQVTHSHIQQWAKEGGRPPWRKVPK